MAATFSREELEDAALLLVIDEDGEYKYSSTHSDREVADVLEQIVKEIREDSD